MVIVCADVMVGMGYNLEEIQDSLAKMKYDEITATYLLLGRKACEVCRLPRRLQILWALSASGLIVFSSFSSSWSPASRPPAATYLWPNHDPIASSTASRRPTSKSKGAFPPATNRDATASKVRLAHGPPQLGPSWH